MSTPENPAAALGRLRWRGVKKADRSKAMSDLSQQATASMTPAQRKARAQKAAKASAKVRAKNARAKKLAARKANRGNAIGNNPKI